MVGLCAAVATGVLSGTMYVPLHYAGDKAKGIEYLVSFGSGAVVVNAGMLAVYFTSCLVTGRPIPSFHVRVTWAPGLATGLLWALGNFFSIMATLYLGQVRWATWLGVRVIACARGGGNTVLTIVDGCACGCRLSAPRPSS